MNHQTLQFTGPLITRHIPSSLILGDQRILSPPTDLVGLPPTPGMQPPALNGVVGVKPNTLLEKAAVYDILHLQCQELPYLKREDKVQLDGFTRNSTKQRQLHVSSCGANPQSSHFVKRIITSWKSVSLDGCGALLSRISFFLFSSLTNLLVKKPLVMVMTNQFSGLCRVSRAHFSTQI